MTTDTTTAPSRSLGATLVRRTAIALAVLVLILLPSVVLFVITKQPSATYASLAALIGIVAVAAGGLRIGIVTAVVSSLLAPIAIVAGLTPITGAALMVIMALTVGRLATYGLHRAVMLVPILLAWPILTPVPWLPSSLLDEVNAKLAASGLTVTEAIAQAQAGSGASSATAAKVAQAMIEMRMDSTYLAWVVLFFFVGAIVPVLVVPFALRKVHLPAPATHPRSETVPYTITIAVLSGAATWYCLDHPKLVAGSFLVATILVLTQVGDDIKWKLTVQRVLGTLGGVLLLTGLMRIMGTVTYTEVLGVPLPMGLYLIGVVFGTLAIIAKFSPRQWIYYVFIAPAAALLNAFTAGQATDFGKQRLVDNVVGSVLVILAMAITLAWSRIVTRNTTPDTPATPAPATSPA